MKRKFNRTDPSQRIMLIETHQHPWTPMHLIPLDLWPPLLPFAYAYYEQDDHWTLLTQFRQSGKFSFYEHRVQAHQDFTLSPHTEYEMYCWHNMANVALDVLMNKDFFLRMQNGTNTLFYLQSNQYDVPMKKGENMLSFHFNMLPSTFHTLTKHYPILKHLYRFFTNRTGSSVNTAPLATNATTLLLIKKFYHCLYDHPIQINTFLERLGLDLLLAFAWQHENSAQPKLIYTVIQEEAFHALFNFLVRNPFHQLSPPALAERFGLSPNMLEIGFRQHFALPIETFTFMVKMMTIFDSIVNEKLPLHKIARQYGFRNTTHLDEVFKEHYDCSIYALLVDHP